MAVRIRSIFSSVFSSKMLPIKLRLSADTGSLSAVSSSSVVIFKLTTFCLFVFFRLLSACVYDVETMDAHCQSIWLAAWFQQKKSISYLMSSECDMDATEKEVAFSSEVANQHHPCERVVCTVPERHPCLRASQDALKKVCQLHYYLRLPLQEGSFISLLPDLLF